MAFDWNAHEFSLGRSDNKSILLVEFSAGVLDILVVTIVGGVSVLFWFAAVLCFVFCD